VRDIKKEFAMINEMQVFAATWLVLTNLLLFFNVQGSLAGWFDNNQNG